MKQDAVSNVVQVGFLNFTAEVRKTRGLAHAVEQLGRLRCCYLSDCGKSSLMGGYPAVAG